MRGKSLRRLGGDRYRDQLIRAIEGAHNALLDLEELEGEELDPIRESCEELARTAREQLKQGRRDDRVVQLNP